MENYSILEDEYLTDSSSDSFYEVHVDMGGGGKKSERTSNMEELDSTENQGTTPGGFLVGSSSTQTIPSFGTEFQEMVLRALFQATGALIAPPPPSVSIAQQVSRGSSLLSGEGLSPASTWKAATFNKVEAQRRNKPKMNRTSAGEDSDSQQDFPVPENETTQQKSVRTWRLNRCRGRRAKELTNNRRALNKLPYVLHVDSMGKAKGIHKHQWRAAVRGQCGRLDPSMDNINHHSKHVVDSIWHALEKEWEFEGFTHRAREMFEKSATKFMRNKKMQLKYKCQKTGEALKPNDVNDRHWTKIVDITRKSMKQSTSSTSMQRTPNAKEIMAVVEDDKNPSLSAQGTEGKKCISSANVQNVSQKLELEVGDVDAKIRSLKNELMRLQNSRKGGFCVKEVKGGHEVNTGWEVAVVSGCDKDSMKENVRPSNVDPLVTKEAFVDKFLEDEEADLKTQVMRSGISLDALQQVSESEPEEIVKDSEMQCGDLIRLLAVVGGMKKEIGKGIVMGLSGSKYTKKIIPKGWRSVKVTSYTSIGFGEACPIPSGWTEHAKQRTVKEASGRTILWPDTLLRSVRQM